MPIAEDPFAKALDNWRRRLSDKEQRDYEGTSLNDLRMSIIQIQNRLETTKDSQNMKRLSKFMEAMEQFGRVIEVFANSTVYVAFIWGPIKFILQTASHYADVLDDLLDAYKDIGEHFPLLETYLSLFRNNNSLADTVVSLYEDILTFHRKVIRKFSGSSWKLMFKSVWKSFNSEFKHILDDMKRHKSFIQELASVLHMDRYQRDSQENKNSLEQIQMNIDKIQSDGHKLQNHANQYQMDRDETLRRAQRYTEDRNKFMAGFEKIQEYRNQTRYTSIIEWLGASKSTVVDHYEYCRVREQNPESGQWILGHENMENWIDPDVLPPSSILWLTGIMGAGKTILTSLIIETCQQTPVSTAYFYCSEGDEKRNDSTAVFTGLLTQLIAQSRDFEECNSLIPYCYEKSSAEISPSPKSAEDLLTYFCNTFSSLFLIVDGLDECEQDKRKYIITALAKIVTICDKQNPGKVRVLLVSRYLHDIKTSLVTATCLDLQKNDTLSDITNYARFREQSLRERFGLTIEQGNHIVEEVVTKAEGMFLFAELVLNNLHDQPNKEELEFEITHHKIPDKLEDAYNKIIERLERTLGKAKWRCSKKLLGWLVCSKRVLRWREIQAAISMDTETLSFDFEGKQLRDHITYLCGSLVRVLDDSRVELIHTTAKTCIPQTDLINTATVECELATLCLNYLTFDCFNSRTLDGDLENMVIRGDLAFQDYAISKWFLHVFAVTERENIETIFNEAQNSRTALQNFGTAIAGFTNYYKLLNPENTTAREDALSRCLPFENCEFLDHGFYSQLFLVVLHTLDNQRQGFDARNKVSISSLKDALERNRKLVEELTKSNIISEHGGFIEKYGNKNFKCSLLTCYYFHEGFIEAKVRDAHIKRHTRPFLCPESTCTNADIGFISNNELDKHKRVYHPEIGDKLNSFGSTPKGIQPHKCDICGKGFTRSSILKEHTLSHYGQRPHPCSKCGKAFTRKSDCVRHETQYCRK